MSIATIKLLCYYYLFLFVLFVVYLIFRKVVAKKQDKINLPIFYVKMLPFALNEKAVGRFKLITQFFLTILATAAMGFIILDNLSPLGATVAYSLAQSKSNISAPGPKNRVTKTFSDGQIVYKQTHDLIYFTTDIPFYFDTAAVKFTFLNPSPDQDLLVGFQDKESWHYDTKLFDAPLINSLSWKYSGTYPVLYQRKQNFNSAQAFLAHLPKDTIIGTYNYDLDLGNESTTVLANYIPQKEETVIDVPLRGRHVLYAYVHNEPFHVVIEKQDLNWYEDPDVMTVRVYKGMEKLYETSASDDGIIDNSRRILPPQKVTINGPKEIENGVYKIIIDANGDTIIRSIRTNLHKVVFQGSIFPVSNSTAYKGIISSTLPTTLYTNAFTLSALTYHENGRQNIAIDDQIFKLDTLKTEQVIIPKKELSKIVLPKNDVVLKGYFGYFSFAESQFFSPSEYHVIPLNSSDDLNMIDYLVADYSPPQEFGKWKVAERTFDLRSAVVKNGKLNWIISAPKLRDNNKQILIKNIEVVFNKKSWF